MAKSFKMYLILGFIAIACNTPQKEMKMIEKEAFGKLPTGEAVDLYTLRNTKGMEVKISNYGGIITTWLAADKNGSFDDIVLGMDSLQGYLNGVPYFGAIVGRYGNRISKGKFELDGIAYDLAKNNGENALHGGIKGFDKVLWTAEEINENEAKLVLNYTSIDGEEGYPGALKVKVTYTLDSENALKIDYQAETDKTTIVNLTNHSYFNLSKQGTSVLNHEVKIEADRFIPVDASLIPTGEIALVKDTPFDFTSFHKIGERIDDTTNTQIKLGGGYDHCWAFTDNSTNIKLVAEVKEATSGRKIEVFTTEPGVQFYTGNFLKGDIKGKKGVVYGKRSGFCLETQHFPDAPNQANFPSTVLKAGEKYETTTVYKIGIE